MSFHKDLTPRQRQVMELIAQGMTTRQVAESLGLSCHYVRNLRYVIRWRLGFKPKEKLADMQSMEKINPIDVEGRVARG